jgi:hypothetical protein
MRTPRRRVDDQSSGGTTSAILLTEGPASPAAGVIQCGACYRVPVRLGLCERRRREDSCLSGRHDDCRPCSALAPLRRDVE